MMARKAAVIRLLAVAAMTSLAAMPVSARDSLGVFEGWGAFRDAQPLRCYAIARPARDGGGGRWRPFASVATWPDARPRGQAVNRQIHVRLSREIALDAPVILSIGSARFTLVGGGADVWAADSRSDAAIVTAMRGATSMSIAARASTGSGFADTYALRGAATAIDAAALGCARRG